MNYEELLLKTAFCTMACDGDIAKEEIQYIKEITEKFSIEKILDIDKTLKQYVTDINVLKSTFLDNYITELGNQQLTEEQELQIASLAIKMILADEIIEYSEIKFFKKIRSKLKCTDKQIKEILPEDSDDPNMPTKEDFLASDVIVTNDNFWGNISFKEIHLDTSPRN